MSAPTVMLCVSVQLGLRWKCSIETKLGREFFEKKTNNIIETESSSRKCAESSMRLNELSTVGIQSHPLIYLRLG